MKRQWTFGQKMGLGLAAMVAVTALIAAVAIYALRDVVAAKDAVIVQRIAVRVDAERLNEIRARKSAAARAFLLDANSNYLADLQQTRDDLDATLARLDQAVKSSDGIQLLRAVRRSNADFDGAIARAIETRKSSTDTAVVARTFESEVIPRRDQVVADIRALVEREERLMDEARSSSTATADRAVGRVTVTTAGAALLGLLLALLLGRSVSSQIGTAVSQVQASSAELQAASRQQASAAKEQATAMTEVSTTMNELLATSRQIAESSRRVSQIADDTATTARTGDGTVERAHAQVMSIRRQMDLVVTHMGDLSRTSQKVGAVLDIVAELAEQTNILAINATIEAAGAGEHGKRFGVVADEIRKLADRVAGSTREIRALVDEVRGGVNTTVMVTETGSKAVDLGAQHFGEVAASFQRIATMVSTTTEAAREIELSTKQQSSAVEQVNGAIASVAQSTRETEAGTSQTLQTAGQLAALSRDLLRMVRTDAAG